MWTCTLLNQLSFRTNVGDVYLFVCQQNICTVAEEYTLTNNQGSSFNFCLPICILKLHLDLFVFGDDLECVLLNMSAEHYQCF